MINIRTAESHDISELKKIWRYSFGDQEDYINIFFSELFNSDDTLLLSKDGQTVSMLTMTPVSIVNVQPDIISARMIYAGATHPDHRGMGYSGSLLQRAEQMQQAKGEPVALLTPANSGLFDFYKLKGYQSGLRTREFKIDNKNIKDIKEKIDNTKQMSFLPIEPEEYNQRRHAFLAGKRHVAYQNRQISYQKKISQLGGADIFGVDYGDEQGCIAVELPSFGPVIGKEALLSEESLGAAIVELARLFPNREYIIRIPTFVGQNLGVDVRSLAMYKKTIDIDCMIDGVYLGLAFD